MSRVTATKSGTVATVKSPGKVPIRNLKVNFSPAQSGSGDPSPSNVRPITGWAGVNVTQCGKNLFDKTTAVRKDYYYLDDNGNEINSSVSGYLTSKTPVKPNTVYTFRSDNIVIESNMSWRIYFFDKNGTFISRITTQIEDLPYTFTTPSNCTDISFQYNIWSLDHDGKGIGNWQLELGSSVTAYEAYTGTTLPVTFPSEAGTVYGGSVDLVTGELTAEWAIVKLTKVHAVGTSGTGIPYADVYFYEIDMPAIIANTEIICSDYKWTTVSTTGAEGLIKTYAGAFTIYDNRFTSKEAAASILSNVYVCYPLATPVTYTLTPQQLSTLIGYNNIYSDADSVEVAYDLAESAEMMRVRQRIMAEFARSKDTPVGYDLLNGINWQDVTLINTSTGEYSGAQGYSSSLDFIPINRAYQYTASDRFFVYYYESDGTYINWQVMNSPRVLVIPENASKIKVSINTQNKGISTLIRTA